jgi:hypothetical protein
MVKRVCLLGCAFHLLLGVVIGGSQITVSARKVPVKYEAEVVVVGGGISGTAAAIAAARTGAKTLIVEKAGFLSGAYRTGGLAGFFGNAGGDWLPEITEGLAHDFIKMLVRLQAPGASTLEEIERTGAVWIDPEITAHAFYLMAKEAGVKILFHAPMTQAVVQDQQIQAIVMETVEGAIAVRGEVFIDATGLDILGIAAGVPVGKEDPSMGLLGLLGGVSSQRYAEFCRTEVPFDEEEYRAWFDKLTEPCPVSSWRAWWERTPIPLKLKYREAIEKEGFRLFERVGEKGCLAITEGLKVIFDSPEDVPAGSNYIAPRRRHLGDLSRTRTNVKGIDPLNYEHVNRAEMLSHKHLFENLYFLRKHVPGFEDAFMLRVSDEIGARGGRYILTEARPSFEQVKEGNNEVSDCIYVVRRPTHRGKRPFQVSYRVMLPQKIDNLLMVGRSAAGFALRNMAGVFIMGQAGGTAAALSVRSGVIPRRLAVPKLQMELRKNGVRIPEG